MSICSNCKKELKMLDNHGTDARPLCFDCAEKEKSAKKIAEIQNPEKKKCPYCGRENGKEVKKCECGYVLSGYSDLSERNISNHSPGHDPIAVCFYILGCLEFVGGIILCVNTWPKEADLATIFPIIYLLSGTIFGLLFIAVARIIDYLKDISLSLKNGK